MTTREPLRTFGGSKDIPILVLFGLVMLVVILPASTALGLTSINRMSGTMLSYIPTLISAIVIVILGRGGPRDAVE